MAKPAARPKSRIGLFSVGRNKASPARTASTKRASMRRSVARHSGFDFQDAGDPEARGSVAEQIEHGGPKSYLRDNPVPFGDIAGEMKDAPLPSLPDEPPSSQKSRSSAPRQPPQAKPTRLPPNSRMPPPQPPQHSVTMPSPRQPPQQTNLFKRFTSKFRSNEPTKNDPPQISLPQRKGTVLRMPKAPAPSSQGNDFTSVERRQAALRARGLVPATSAVPRRFRNADGYMMTLAEQEAEIDRRFTVVIPRSSSSEETSESEAKKIREAWLSKQTEAAAPVFSEAANRPSSRTSDAMERASQDGTVGQMGPVRPTFIEATTLSPIAGEIGGESPTLPASPLTATVEDFHTAPNTPAKFEGSTRQSADYSRPKSPPTHLTSASVTVPKKEGELPTTPASESSAVTDKVSRWLRTSTELSPAVPIPANPDPADPLVSSPDNSESLHVKELPAEPKAPAPAAVTPTSTVRARKEKPPPIIVTSRQSQDASVKAPEQAIAVTVSVSAPSESDASTSEASASASDESRGRQAPPETPPRLAHSSSTASSGARSRTTTVPALSPTRTVSSSGASSSLPTPTTTSFARDISISRGSTSHSSDGGHERPRRPTGEYKAKIAAGAGAVIMEEYSETEPSSEGGEFGAAPTAQSQPPSQQQQQQHQAQGAVGNARVRVAEQPQQETATKQQNRKSFSLFGKKSLDLPRDTRTASSMSNLRRAFTSTKPRPKSSLDAGPGSLEGIPETGVAKKQRSRMFDASHLPASPTVPSHPNPNPNPSSPTSAKFDSRTTGVGLRAQRQAVAPTIHSRGSILLQAHTIEDEESRRLSEMAFLS